MRLILGLALFLAAGSPAQASVTWPLDTSAEWVRCEAKDAAVELYMFLYGWTETGFSGGLKIKDDRFAGGILQVSFRARDLVSFRDTNDLFDMRFRHNHAKGAVATSTELSIATSGEDLIDDAFYYAGAYSVFVTTPGSESTPAATVRYTGTLHCGFD